MCELYGIPSMPLSITNPLNAMLNPICHLLALLGAHHILHISRIRVKEQKLNFEKFRKPENKK
jgi:hypothetical protein